MWISKNLGIGYTLLINEKNVIPPVSFTDIIKNDASQNAKYLLIVNLASKCGFTPQYNELETLYKQYRNKLVILGFPSNDFRRQEPGSDEEIASFCKLNYGVTFKILPKDHVIGHEKQEVYQWLTDPQKNGWNKQEPAWNFHKYLLNPDGILLGVFSPAVSPLSNHLTKLLK